MSADNLPHALDYGSRGVRVFPVDPVKKTPLIKAYHQKATTDPDVIRQWWTKWPDALIGHALDGDVAILDIDPRHNGHHTWEALTSLGDIDGDRRHYSGRGDGGTHHWYKRPPGVKLAIGLLNKWAEQHGVGKPIVDTETGEKVGWNAGIDLLTDDHRYTILPPSLHPDTGKPYWWETDCELGDIPDVLDELGDMPVVLAELLEKEPPPPKPTTPGLPKAAGEVGETPADWYTDNHTWNEVLEARHWMLVYGSGDEDGSLWKHPAATQDHSASIKNRCLFVYSSNTPFQTTQIGDPHGYTRFRAYAVLEHGGDESAAATDVRLNLMPKPATTSNPPTIDDYLDDEGEDGGEGERRLLFVVEYAPHPFTPKPVNWLATGLLCQPTHGELGGAQKALKSYVMHGTLVGIALGEKVFGRFVVPTPRRSLVLTGEGGRNMFNTRTARIADAYGATTGDLHGMFGFTPVTAPVTSDRFRRALAHAIDEFDPDIIWMDPWYAYAGGDVSSSQLTEVGERLAFIRSFIGDDRTLFINHHLNQTGTGDSLTRLSGAGHAEWVDSWLLSSHYEKPDVESGRFRLKLQVGSRQWGGAEYLLNYNIGRFDELMGVHEGGITWKVEPLVEARSAEEEFDRKLSDAKVRVIQAWKKRRGAHKNDPLTKTAWLDLANGTAAENRRAFAHLVDDRRIVPALVDGERPKDPHARGLRYLLNPDAWAGEGRLEDSNGHSDMLPDHDLFGGESG